ncbi:hypothetical protein SKA94_13180, partial [Enterococcus faecium]
IVIPPAIFFYYSTLFDSRFKTLQQNPFLDNTWGTWYDCYLKKLGFQNIDIDAIECLKEVDNKYEEEPYYLLQQKLANDSVFQVEVWENEDGTYEGLAQEIPLSEKKCSI